MSNSPVRKTAVSLLPKNYRSTLLPDVQLDRLDVGRAVPHTPQTGRTTTWLAGRRWPCQDQARSGKK